MPQTLDCVEIEGRAYVGRFIRVRLGEGGCRKIQLSNRYLILPGMVDIHVHFRDWGLSHKETLWGGAKAALAGGVVAVGDMPNTKPFIRTAELYRKRIQEGSQLPVVYRLHMGVPEDLGDLEAAAPPSVKIYPEDIEAFGWSHIEALLKKCAELKCLAVFHCEDPAYFDGVERPPEAEAACVEKVKKLARHTGAAVHLTHVTLPETVEAARGWATVDVTPHHLLLDRENCRDFLCFVNPRLRDPQTRKRLLALFAAGYVDIYATDHAPHTLEEKKNLAPGICNIEVALSVLLTMWKRGILTLGDVLRLYHFRPARLLRVDVDIWRGYYTVVKLEEFQVRGGDFAGSCKFTPFERRSLYGRVVATAVGGRLFTEFFT